MKCWNCKDMTLVWGGDEDSINEDGELEIVTNLYCPACDAVVFFHHGPRFKNMPDWAKDLLRNEPEVH